jgi:hypothetical protein
VEVLEDQEGKRKSTKKWTRHVERELRGEKKKACRKLARFMQGAEVA